MLGVGGIDGVRVELIATRLGVTKGSFYWHFDSRDALHMAMLDHWRREATLALIEQPDRRILSPDNRLREMLRRRRIGSGGDRREVELSLRLWAKREQRAQVVVGEVDRLRLRYLAQLMIASGSAACEAEARAVLAYAYLQAPDLSFEGDAAATVAFCEALLIGRGEA